MWGEWPASHPGRFTSRKNCPRYPLDRSLFGPQSQSEQGFVEKNSQPPPGIEPRSSDRPSRSQSLYWLQGLGICLFTTASRPALGPIPLPIRWVPGALSLGGKQPGSEADHKPHLVPRSRMRRATIPVHNTPSWRGAQLKQRDNLTFYITIVTNKFIPTSKTCQQAEEHAQLVTDV
jgi:hypothetical protein